MPANWDPTTTYIVTAVVIIAIVAIVVALVRRNTSSRLQQRFGSEYDRTVNQTGNRTAAERVLSEREARVKKLHLQELPPGARSRYAEEWHDVQTRFVDEPAAALTAADALVINVMRDRGYPMDSFDQRVADLSPDHPSVIDNYRAAHAIASRNERGEATTEELRQAMVHYRALFDELVGAAERQRS